MRKIILSVILITILVLSVFSIYLFPESTALGERCRCIKIRHWRYGLDVGSHRTCITNDTWTRILLWWNGRQEKCNQYGIAKLYGDGHSNCFMGCNWIWFVFWTISWWFYWRPNPKPVF